MGATISPLATVLIIQPGPLVVIIDNPFLRALLDKEGQSLMKIVVSFPCGGLRHGTELEIYLLSIPQL